MRRLAGLVAMAVVSVLAGGCASPQIGSREVPKSERAAVELLAQSREAHGAKAFGAAREVAVRYEGKWAAIGPRFQPILADTSFRRASTERVNLGSRTMVQEHSGPAGTKLVIRRPGTVTVKYNGKVSQDAEVKRAAALVADAYTLFLLGPFYFERAGAKLAMDGEGVVDGALCDEVLAVLRPGFGFAVEDRVVLSIDRTIRQLRRVRMTLNGLESTRGAEVDVTFREHRTIGGVLWPTEFDERIRLPFDLHAHHWRTLDLAINRELAGMRR